MSSTLNVTESDLFTALRSFLLTILGTSVEVIQAQNNRVPMPIGPFVAMTPLMVEGLSTPVTRYLDPGSGTGERHDVRTTRWSVQLDFYGPGAGMQAATVAGIWRTDYAADLLSSGPLQPLYPGDPRQTSIVNAEQQWESRWTLELYAQFNPVITSPQQFADQLQIGLVEVDTKFPPGD